MDPVKLRIRLQSGEAVKDEKTINAFITHVQAQVEEILKARERGLSFENFFFLEPMSEVEFLRL